MTILYVFDAYIICLLIEWSKGLLMLSVFVHYTQCLLFFMSAALLLRAALFMNKNCLIYISLINITVLSKVIGLGFSCVNWYQFSRSLSTKLSFCLQIYVLYHPHFKLKLSTYLLSSPFSSVDEEFAQV